MNVLKEIDLRFYNKQSVDFVFLHYIMLELHYYILALLNTIFHDSALSYGGFFVRFAN